MLNRVGPPRETPVPTELMHRVTDFCLLIDRSMKNRQVGTGQRLTLPLLYSGPSMPKVGMQPIRRRQLIEAAIQAIHQHGYDDVTMARIAARAGLSPGIIAHYFGSKQELLEATMRSLLTELWRLVVAGLSRAQAPLERIEAVVAALFDETQCRPEVVSAWLSFWAQVPHAPDLARLQRAYRRRLRSDLCHGLRGLGLDAPERERLAELVGGLIDGIWVRAALDGGGLDTAAARWQVMQVLRLALAEAGPATVTTR